MLTLSTLLLIEKKYLEFLRQICLNSPFNIYDNAKYIPQNVELSQTGLFVLETHRYDSGELLTELISSGLNLGYYIIPHARRVTGFAPTGFMICQISVDVNKEYYPNSSLKATEILGYIIDATNSYLELNKPHGIYIPEKGVSIYPIFSDLYHIEPTSAETFHRSYVIVRVNYCCQIWK